METDENELADFLSERRTPKTFRARKKNELAREFLKIILEAREKCLTKKS